VNFLPVYLDASAIVKLVRPEPESDALMSALARWPDRVTVSVARVEVHRALRRLGASAAEQHRADAVLSSLVVVRIDDAILTRAEALKDADLRALDAIHLASALTLGDDPEAFISYDARRARAAERAGLPVQHPGADRLS
jgi:predicted nucleic acid-binding protein